MTLPSGKIVYECAAALLAVLIAASHNQHTVMLLLRLRWGILCRCELLPKHISLHPDTCQMMQLGRNCTSKK